MRHFSALVVAFLCLGQESVMAKPTTKLPALPHSSRALSSTPASLPSKSVTAVSRGGGGGMLASYSAFSKARPFENGVIISLIKTALADALAQAALPGAYDFARTAMFGLFGAVYLGMFQYFYQVLVFKKLFKSTERFTSATWAEKAKDVDGLISLFFQICVDMCVLTFAYLPTFYIFKSAAFSPECSGLSCASDGYGKYINNLAADFPPLLTCWVPADLLCFSIPLHLRLPIRHIWSFVWHVYLSYFRGASH